MTEQLVVYYSPADDLDVDAPEPACQRCEEPQSLCRCIWIDQLRWCETAAQFRKQRGWYPAETVPIKRGLL